MLGTTRNTTTIAHHAVSMTFTRLYLPVMYKTMVVCTHRARDRPGRTLGGEPVSTCPTCEAEPGEGRMPSSRSTYCPDDWHVENDNEEERWMEREQRKVLR